MKSEVVEIFKTASKNLISGVYCYRVTSSDHILGFTASQLSWQFLYVPFLTSVCQIYIYLLCYVLIRMSLFNT
jgi:hypothetical protein